MARRGISEDEVRRTLASPEDVFPVRDARVVPQAVFEDKMIRGFVDVDRDPPEDVTVYRTRKIDEYRSLP
jgi:hypothetical protein